MSRKNFIAPAKQLVPPGWLVGEESFQQRRVPLNGMLEILGVLDVGLVPLLRIDQSAQVLNNPIAV